MSQKESDNADVTETSGNHDWSPETFIILFQGWWFAWLSIQRFFKCVHMTYSKAAHQTWSRNPRHPDDQRHWQWREAFVFADSCPDPDWLQMLIRAGWFPSSPPEQWVSKEVNTTEDSDLNTLAAINNGLSPVLRLLICTLAPWDNRALTTSELPLCAPNQRAVLPSSSLALMSAPRLSRKVIISTLPLWSQLGDSD